MKLNVVRGGGLIGSLFLTSCFLLVPGGRGGGGKGAPPAPRQATAPPKPAGRQAFDVTIDNQSDKPICKITTVEGKDDVAKFDAKTPADCIAPKAKKVIKIGPSDSSGYVSMTLYEGIGGTVKAKYWDGGPTASMQIYDSGDDKPRLPIVVNNYNPEEVWRTKIVNEGDSVITEESRDRAYKAYVKENNAAFAQCMARVKKPAGAVTKNTKFTGKWHCILSGYSSGNAMIVFTQNGANTEANIENWIRGAGGDSLVVVGQPHGDTLFSTGGDDGPNWLFQRQGNTMRITYVDFAEDDGCMQTQFACTAGH